LSGKNKKLCVIYKIAASGKRRQNVSHIDFSAEKFIMADIFVVAYRICYTDKNFPRSVEINGPFNRQDEEERVFFLDTTAYAKGRHYFFPNH